jgi:transcriptional regulator with XRE-family HTH domain
MSTMRTYDAVGPPTGRTTSGSRVDDQKRKLGARLRSIRRQQGMTLHDVEARSDGEWKAVVVGSYERGDRAISVVKLARLAEFYGVPLHDLLPEPAPSTLTRREPEHGAKVRLDLTALPDPDSDGVLGGIARYARRIQIERGDYNGRVLTIRHDDVHAIALAFGAEPGDVISELEQATALLV